MGEHLLKPVVASCGDPIAKAATPPAARGSGAKKAIEKTIEILVSSAVSLSLPPASRV